MRNSWLRLLVPVLLVLYLQACTHIDKEVGQAFRAPAKQLLSDAEPLDVDAVLELLGPPQKLSALPDGYVFLYQRFHVMESQFGFSTDMEVLRWLKLALADADVKTDTLLLQFDGDDRVVAAGLSSSLSDLGEAGGIMFALQVMEIVDSQQYSTDTWGVNLWGMSLLQDVPTNLNRQSGPDSGQAGIELRGTPQSVGQRTLEFP